mgnify:CR=1 FL=1
MHQLSIKKLFFYLITLGISFSIAYISISYSYIEKTLKRSLDLESINKAYYVSKKLTEMNDKIAREYTLYEEDMYQSLKEAQLYFEKNPRDVSLLELKKILERDRKDIEYHIYIINSDYVIENTTLTSDMGLDFKTIPDAFQILNNTYKNSEHIDLSTIKDDAVNNDYKRYILQRSYNGDYLIQLSLTINNSKSLKEFTLNMKETVDNLLSREIYSIYFDLPIYIFLLAITFVGKDRRSILRRTMGLRRLGNASPSI